MAAWLAPLLGILVQAGMKLIGYEFITTVLCASAEEWAMATKTHWDDKVVMAMAKALGCSVDDLKKLQPSGES